MLKTVFTCLVSAFVGLSLGSPAQAGRLDDEKKEDSTYPVDVEAVPRPEAWATRIDEDIVIDGKLEEPAWKRATPITGFIQSQPAPGYPATEETVTWVLYDEDNMYVGAICYDSEPDRVVIPTLEQDFDSRNSDVFAFSLDTFLDRRNSFLIMINPGGAIKEEQTFNDSRNVDLAWEGVIEQKVTMHDDSWVVEVRVPFTTLRFDPKDESQSWGLNILRRIRRKNEESYWAPLQRRDRIHKMSKAGTLHGLDGIKPGRNLKIKPYGSVANERMLLDEGVVSNNDLDAGIDAKYGVTTGLTLDLTYRTDFSQVEVNQQRVNLTRFSLFFPEKRDFFIENSGSFKFGDVTERSLRFGSSLRQFTLFHSRRIGLDEDGLPIPILAGGRLTGRAGDFELGFLNMQTKAKGVFPAENFTVARVRRNLMGFSDVGAIFINRQATDGSGGYNRSYGVDANLRPISNLVINTYLAGTDDSEEQGDEWAGRLAVGWRDPLWDTSAFVKHVGDAFVPRVGFVRRRGINHAYATFGAHPRRPMPHVLEFNPYTEIHYVTNLEGVLETRTVTGAFGIEFLDGGMLTIRFDDWYERLFEDFEIYPDAVIPVGEYPFRESGITFQSSKGRRLSGSVGVTQGGFFNGDKTTLDLSAFLRWNEHLSLDFFAQHNAVSLPNLDFTADVFGGRVNYAATTKISLSGFIQYNEAVEELVSNVRFNFIHSPLSDLFVVYTERRSTAGLGLMDRLFTVKVTKMFEF